MRPLLIAALLFQAAAGFSWAGTARADSLCPIPEGMELDAASLPATAAALSGDKPILVVAVGSGSTLGAASGDPRYTYPARLEQYLKAAFPHAAITVENRGAARLDTNDMLGRIERDVLPRRPALVIWEAGTNDAARGRDIDEFGQDLKQGIDKLLDAKIDVVVMDMQYAPSTASLIDFQPYLEALHQVAELDNVPVFRRYDIMESWGDAGLFVYDDTSPAERTATARRVYDCIAAGLSDGIVKALAK